MASRIATFLGIGAGNRHARRAAAARTRAAADAETDEEMRARHARELREAGYAEDKAAGDKKPPEDAAPEDDDGDDDGDAAARTGDRLPPDDNADPDDDPAESVPAGGDDDSEEDEEDEAVDRMPDEDARRAKRAKLRRARRAKARKAERARCAQIFQSTAAAKNVGLAAELAFNTSLSASRAVAVLERGGAAATDLGTRMAAYGTQLGVVGSGAAPPRPANALAASWDATMKKVRTW